MVLTSNRTREVHDALKRRCLYHWVEHPGFDREVAILRRRLPEVTERLAREVAAGDGAAARRLDLLKPPGVAESMDWATALHALGARELDPDTAAPTLGAVLKYREDTERVRRRRTRCSPVAGPMPTPHRADARDAPRRRRHRARRSPARCGRPGWRRPATASQAMLAAVGALDVARRRATSTGPAG